MNTSNPTATNTEKTITSESIISEDLDTRTLADKNIATVDSQTLTDAERVQFRNPDNGNAFKGQIREILANIDSLSDAEVLIYAERLFVTEQAHNPEDAEKIKSILKAAESGDAAALAELRSLVKETLEDRLKTPPPILLALLGKGGYQIEGGGLRGDLSAFPEHQFSGDLVINYPNLTGSSLKNPSQPIVRDDSLGVEINWSSITATAQLRKEIQDQINEAINQIAEAKRKEIELRDKLDEETNNRNSPEIKEALALLAQFGIDPQLINIPMDFIGDVPGEDHYLMIRRELINLIQKKLDEQEFKQEDLEKILKNKKERE